MPRSNRHVADWPEPFEPPGLDPPPAEARDNTRTPLDDESPWPKGFIEWFVVSQTAIPAMLYLPGSQAYRLPLRIGAYAIALFGFGLWWFGRSAKSPARHPAQRWLLLVLGCLVLMISHPLTNSLLAGIAQTLLYFAIFCPLFWAPGWVNRPRQLVRILAILLVCNGVNSMVGVLQVYDPDRWMPRELSFVYTEGSDARAAATYMGPNGRPIIRPPGLFDTPGAVCGPGTLAALLGLVFALEPFPWWKRAAALTFSFAGISAIYLSHVRANFVVTIGMMVIYAGLLSTQRQKTRAAAFTMTSVGLVAFGLSAATLLGGESIQQRFSSLLEEDPRTVYYKNRGEQVEYAFNKLIGDYPFGAGLARWGMMRGYFGDPAHFDSTELWAEIQPNAWIMDGGIFLLGLYGVALLVTVGYEWRLIRMIRDPDDKLWATAIVAANCGTLALLFTFVPFATQVGLQFWFLEGALHGAIASRLKPE